MKNLVFGLDVGGTGIKGAIVNIKTGQLETERFKLATPQPATPEHVAETSRKVIENFGWKGPIGIGFPAIIKKGVCYSATNIDPSWIGTDVVALIKKHTGLKAKVINDADAAGMCEMKFGVLKGNKSLVMLATVGTGIGCGLFFRKRLIPNCEMGVSYMPNGKMLERHCSNAARKRENLSWEQFGNRLNEGLGYIDRLLSIEMIALGGGISKSFNEYKDYLDPELKVTPAKYRNEAGCIGAALLQA